MLKKKIIVLQQHCFLRCGDKRIRSIITSATKFACGSNGKGTDDAQETHSYFDDLYTSYVTMLIYYLR